MLIVSYFPWSRFLHACFASLLALLALSLRFWEACGLNSFCWQDLAQAKRQCPFVHMILQLFFACDLQHAGSCKQGRAVQGRLLSERATVGHSWSAVVSCEHNPCHSTETRKNKTPIYQFAKCACFFTLVVFFRPCIIPTKITLSGSTSPRKLVPNDDDSRHIFILPRQPSSVPPIKRASETQLIHHK